MRRSFAVLVLGLVSIFGSGCSLLFLGEGEEGRQLAIGLFCGDSLDACSCLAICEVRYDGSRLALGGCAAPADVFDCGGRSRSAPATYFPRIPLGSSYEAPADAWFVLGSHEVGAASGQEIGFRVDPSVVETYRAVATYPPDFGWLGFDALGGAPVGAFGFDLDLDGLVDFEVPVLPNGPDDAYVDVDGSGAPSPPDVTVQHSGAHEITVVLPSGGDGNPATILSAFAFDARIRLFAGVMTNPATPGPSALSVAFTSVDADTGGPDDAMGDTPGSFTVGDTVEIENGPCPSAPAPGCAASFAKGALSIVDRGGAKDKVALKLKRGVAGEDAFGDPLDLTSHATCVYDGTDALILELPVAAGGTDARGKPLWKSQKSGARYKNKSGNTAGVTAVKQKGGARAKVQLRGKGDALPLPPLPLTAPLVVQHRTLDGTCVEATFDTLAKNDAGRIQAKLK